MEESRRRDELRKIEAKVRPTSLTNTPFLFLLLPLTPQHLPRTLQEELDRLNKRRAEREVEQQLREEEEARMARMAESAQMAEWISKGRGLPARAGTPARGD